MIHFCVKKWAATWQNQQSDCAPNEDSDHSLGIRPVWSESSLCAQWVAKDPSFQAFFMQTAKTLIRLGRFPGWIRPGWSESLLGAHAILLVLSWGGSNCQNSFSEITAIDAVLQLSQNTDINRNSNCNFNPKYLGKDSWKQYFKRLMLRTCLRNLALPPD